MTMANVPRCLKMLTRKRDSPVKLNDRSAEPCSSSVCSATLLLPMSALAMPAVCAGVSSSMPGMFTAVSLPINSTCGGRPGEKIRSDILSDTDNINCTTCEKLIVDIGRDSSRGVLINGLHQAGSSGRYY